MNDSEMLAKIQEMNAIKVEETDGLLKEDTNPEPRTPAKRAIQIIAQ